MTFSTAAHSGPVEVRVALPQETHGYWSNGECLAARQFTRDDLELFIGGGDVDYYTREIAAGRLPSRGRADISRPLPVGSPST